MSRTIRRKHYEKTQRNAYGSKTNGYYTEYGVFVKTGNGHEGYFAPRPMTPREKAQEYWRIHGESKHSCAWSANRYWYRLPAEVELREYNKREMIRYLDNPDEHEPMFFSKPFSRVNDSYSMW